MSLGLLAAGGLNLAGGIMAADATRDAARIAADASRFAPIDINSGIANTTFTEGGGFNSQLTPELQALRDQLLGAGQTGLNQFQTFDPAEAGKLFTQQLDTLAMPGEEQNRLALENRLFSQGLLGSTTGANRSEALLSAQALAANQRQLTGVMEGQGQQERLFQNALGGIQGATTLDNLAASQLQQAIAAGGANTSANIAGAQFQFEAGQNRADAISGFFSGLGNGMQDFAFNQPPPPPTGSFSPNPSYVDPFASVRSID